MYHLRYKDVLDCVQLSSLECAGIGQKSELSIRLYNFTEQLLFVTERFRAKIATVRSAYWFLVNSSLYFSSKSMYFPFQCSASSELAFPVNRGSSRVEIVMSFTYSFIPLMS